MLRVPARVGSGGRVKMTANSSRRPTHPGAPALIEHNGSKFLIVNKPSTATMPHFIKVRLVFSLASMVTSLRRHPEGHRSLGWMGWVSGGSSVCGSSIPSLLNGFWLYELAVIVLPPSASSRCNCVRSRLWCSCSTSREPVAQASLPLQEMKKHDVSVVVRCCDPTYSTEALVQEGIKVMVSAGCCLP